MEQLVARACVLGICGGDWERVIDLTPDRLIAQLEMADRLRAAHQLDMLIAFSHAFSGGRSAQSLAEHLRKTAAGEGGASGKRWRESKSKGQKKDLNRRPVQT